MKQLTILIVAIVTITFSAKSQNFDGIYIGGSLNSFVDKLKAKGYKLLDLNAQYATLTGTIANTEVEVYVGSTPKTKVVSNITIYLPKETYWQGLKSSYIEYLTILSDKYGKPDMQYTGFTSPYYEGDGYEMSAVENEKTNYVAFWFDKSNTNIAIQISKYNQVKILYENILNMAIKEREKNEIKTNSF